MAGFKGIIITIKCADCETPMYPSDKAEATLAIKGARDPVSAIVYEYSHNSCDRAIWLCLKDCTEELAI